MLIPPKPKAAITTKIRTTFIAVLILFLVYQVWTNHDHLRVEVVKTSAENLLGLEYQKPDAGGDVLEDTMNQSQVHGTENGIPKKIWYKLGPKGLSEELKTWTGSCIEQNPEYQVTFLTDETAESWVQNTFATSRPDIVDIYTQLTVPILKADLLRYLLLYIEGGVWFDLDVSCEGIPIDEWIPEAYRSIPTPRHNDDTAIITTTIDMVVGYEFDAGFSDFYFHQIATWTILAKPGVSHMLHVINDIVAAVYSTVAAHQLARVADITTATAGDIVDFTGPRRFTRSLLQSIAAARGHETDRHDVENILDPVLLDDKVLLLPGNAFAESMNHFEELGPSSVPRLLTHHYAGSWKNDYGGEEMEGEGEGEEEGEAEVRVDKGDGDGVAGDGVEETFEAI